MGEVGQLGRTLSTPCCRQRMHQSRQEGWSRSRPGSQLTTPFTVTTRVNLHIREKAEFSKDMFGLVLLCFFNFY